MPFADGGGFVAEGFEKRGDIQLAVFKTVAIAFLTESPGSLSGEESIARWGAKGGGGMGVDELGAFLGQLIDVRGVD